VEEQVQHLDTELHALDDIVSRIQSQNNSHHALHVESLQNLGSTVQSSYDNIGAHFQSSFSRVKDLGSDMETRTATLRETLPALADDAEIRVQLRELREAVETQALQEYSVTGMTPAKRAYDYPFTLPQTESHATLLARLRGFPGSAGALSAADEAESAHAPRSPNKGLVYTDSSDASGVPSTATRPASAISVSSTSTLPSLRELDINTLSSSHTVPLSLPSSTTSSESNDNIGLSMPPLKRLHTIGGVGSDSKLPTKRRGAARMTVAAGLRDRDERENAPVTSFSASVGAGGAHPLGRRVLRSGRES
jgi:kinesin family member 11